jgi:5-oxoprolinase (ATP-hydrolysing) subunit A
MLSIDVNCDMGEGFPWDEQILPYISSANVACGFHGGSIESMHRLASLSKKYGLSLGAHPGFADKENFGRIQVNLSTEQIYDLVHDQVELLRDIAKKHDYFLTHVKPHGALYNAGAKNKNISRAIASAVYDIDPDLKLYGLSGSYLLSEASQVGLVTVSEVFADRTYQDDGSLTPRSEPGALIKQMDLSISQVLLMLKAGVVLSTTGKEVSIKAETLCIHGDSNQAADMAKFIYDRLLMSEVRVCAPEERPN